LINFELEIKNIQPINIKRMDLKWYILDENVRKSIILYNKAISEIKTKDFDLAIKDLKKALSYNRGFADAMKLLGLCYAYNEEYRRAKKTFKKLMKNEIYSDLAKEYIGSILNVKAKPNNLKSIRRINANLGNGKKQYMIHKHLRRKIIIGFSILTIFVTSFVITYNLSSKLQANSKKAVNNNDANYSDKDKNIIANKNNEYDNIQKELNNTKSELDIYKNKYDILLILDEVEKNYKDRHYEKAASTLVNMKNMTFDDETKIKFEKLWSDLKTNGLWSIYNQGNRLYKEGKYREALSKLELVYEIGPSSEIMPWITYQLGICYKETNDNTNALLFFQKVKDNYPKSNYASSSERMIDKIIN
jgi:tetratricopeptide (TPR) repeat protein